MNQGGVITRFKRYNENQKYMMDQLLGMGFKLYVDPKYQGCIITTFLQPSNPSFDFKGFFFLLFI